MARMTRAHFELIAETIKTMRHEAIGAEPATIEMVAEEFARVLKRTNPGFKPERFMAATR